jgi:hypothetical protein
MGFCERLRKMPRNFFSCTGVSVSDFDALMAAITPAFTAQEAARKQTTVVGQAVRKRAVGGGRKYKNDLDDQVLMVLMYTRLYLSYDLLKLFFQAEHRSVICRSIGRARPLLEAALPTPKKVLATLTATAAQAHANRRKRIGTLEELKEAYPELVVLIDGTEQPKRRPQDKTKRKSQYSGKKKRHTLKQILTVTPNGLIIEQSPVYDGSVHDFSAFKQTPPEWVVSETLRVNAYLDSGFQGADRLGLPADIRLIQRNKRGNPLTNEQKQLNQIRSKHRIPVEHAIGKRKEYAIAAHIYRNKDELYPCYMNIVAGCVNLRANNRLKQEMNISLF